MADMAFEEAERKRRSLKPLRRIFPYMSRYKGMMAGAMVSLILAAVTTLTLPLAVRRMIDHGFTGANGAFINNYFGMLVLLAALLAIASAGRYYFVITLGERIVSDLRRDVFTHLTKLSPAFFDSTQSGEIVSRLTADTTQIKSAVGATASVALRNLILAFGAIVMMIVTSPKLVGARDRDHPVDHHSFGRVRPVRPAPLARRSGYARECDGLCERIHRLGAHAAGLHQ